MPAPSGPFLSQKKTKVRIDEVFERCESARRTRKAREQEEHGEILKPSPQSGWLMPSSAWDQNGSRFVFKSCNRDPDSPRHRKSPSSPHAQYKRMDGAANMEPAPPMEMDKKVAKALAAQGGREAFILQKDTGAALAAQLRKVHEVQNLEANPTGHMYELFERAWHEVDDPSGYDKVEALPIFNVFTRTCYEGDKEIHKDELHLVPRFFGFLLCDVNKIALIADELSDSSTLSFGEFLMFLRKYTEFEHTHWHAIFSKYDNDGSGLIGIDELSNVLRDLGYTPMRNMLQETLEKADVDDSGEIDFEEFQQLMTNWRAMEGLTKQEYAELEEVFERFDNNGDGELDLEESTRLSRYMGMSENVLKDSSDDAKLRHLPLNWKAFLAKVRRYRESEIAGFKKVFVKHDADGSGQLDASELVKCIQSFGFEPLKKRLAECLKEVDADGSGTLNFEEFVQIMWLYRRTEGFTGEQLEELQAAFKKFDKDNSGEIDAMELGDLLRNEGFSPKLDVLQLLIGEYDVDGSGDIGMREYLKIMRRFRENEIKKFRRLFTRFDADGSGQMATEEIAGVLKELGHENIDLATVEQVIMEADTDQSGEVDWDEFVDLMERYRLAEVRERNRKAGFNDEQVDDFLASFRRYDLDGNGTIDVHELAPLLSDFKMAPRTVKERGELIERLGVCADLAGEERGMITFWVFLRLMRTLEDDDDRASLAVERKAAEKARFSIEEVSEFRAIFDFWHKSLWELGDGCGAANEGKALTSDGIARILRSLHITLPKKSDYQQVEDICTDSDIDGNGNVDFPDFLVVMRRLLDDNFRNINETLARSWP